MARKDVDLVIRAKDEAENVVKGITKALNDFIQAQNGLQAKAEGTEGSLAGLGAALGKLERALTGTDIAGKLARDMDKAAQSLARVERQTESMEKEFAGLQRQVRNVETVTARYQQKLEGAAAAQEKQTRAVAKAKKESAGLRTAYDQSSEAVAKLQKRFDRLPEEIAKASAGFQKSSTRVAELRDQMSRTTTPTQTLVKQLASAERALQDQSTKLTRLRSDYASTGSELRAAGSAVTLFAGQAAQAAANLARQEAVLKKIRANYADLSTKSKASAADQNRLEGSLNRASAALAKQRARLEQAEAGYVELAEAAGKFDRAIKSASQVSKGNLEQQLVQQGLAAQKAKKEFQELDRVAKGYASTMTKAGPPTREVSQRIQFLAQRADEAQFKFLLQEESLKRMGVAYRGLSQDMLSVTQVQARFNAAQTETAQSLRETASEGFRQRQSIRGLHDATRPAADSTRRLARETRAQGDAAARAAAQNRGLAGAYRRIYGDTRQTLSYTQRLRGEVLSLIAAYGGLYGVINVLNSVIDATQVLEAANSRLGVALGGDAGQAADEMDFLRRSANRLGIDLGTLATEYSKFAIATKGTNLEGANTRKIFLSVAEAARVNRSTTKEMSGVFTALVQIVSKGAVQMEELRQQLGDRLPGALTIMADGLGVTTAELIKMMEQGQVTADALIPFGDELDRRFGPGLGEALAGTSVALGRLKNAAFQALVQFGEGGFISAFTDLANKLTELLQDADFAAFMQRASAAMAVLIDTVAVLADNFEFVVAAATGFIGLKLTPLIVAIASAFASLPAKITAAAVAMRAFATGTQATAAGANAAAASVGRLTIAMRALLSSTGLGLLITAASVGIGLWATKADEASEALAAHKEIVDEVRDAYDAVGGSVGEWRESLNELTRVEAEANLNRVKDAVKDLEAQFEATANGTEVFWSNFFGTNLRASVRNVPDELRREIVKLQREFAGGDRSAESFYKAVDEAVAALGEGSEESVEFAERVVQIARSLEEAYDAADESTEIFRALGDDLEDAQEAFDNLGNSASSVTKTLDELIRETSEKFKTAMDQIGEGLEGVNRELEYIEASNALKALGEQAVANAQSADELAAALGRVSDAQAALDQEYGNDVAAIAAGSTGIEAAAALLRESEGFRATPYNDPRTDRNGNQIGPDIFRAGFGSDTITLADGSIKKVTQGIRISIEDANRDLMRRITREFEPLARRGAGSERFDTFNPQQQAALISIAYNYGEIPGRIVDAVRTGTDQQIAAAIRALGGDNGGINRGRRNQEAGLFVATDPNNARLEASLEAEEEARKAAADAAEKARKEAADAAEEAAEAAAEAQEATDQRIEDNDFEISQQRLKNQEREREAAILEAIREAKAEDADISEEELARIREQVGLQYDLENAVSATVAAKEKAEKADERINQLLTQRSALSEQLELAKEDGDSALVDELEEKIKSVNAEMIEAIATAKELWAAVGGDEGKTAIAQLDAANAAAERFGQAAEKNFLDWTKVGDMLRTGLANAFDTFAQKVAAGEDAFESARAAFLQFASDFLLQIAKMIIEQAIFNALKAAFGGTSFGDLIGIGAGHTGGLVGSSRVGSGNQTRSVNPAVFAGAMRYHSGGMIGLRPGEIPIIAKQGEEMLTRDDPRHMLNGGGASAPVAAGGDSPTIINAIDSASVMDHALSTPKGRKVFLNMIRADREAVKRALG